MVSVLAASPVDREFEHGSVQTKDCELVFVVSQD
jgi:hypothetical protein